MKSIPDGLVSLYRFSAHIDTIMLEFETVAACKPGSLKAVTGAAWVESLEPELIGSGSGSSCWRLKLEDPTLASVQALCNAVSSRWGLVSTPAISWIDVALDAKLKGLDKRRNSKASNSVEQYRDLLFLMRDSLRPPKLGDGWRYSASKDDSPDLADFPSGMTAYLGERPVSQDAPVTSSFYRLYWKVMDKGQAVGDRDRRARLECRIGRFDLESLGVVTVADLERFRWRSLARWFWFGECDLMPIADCMGSIRSLGLVVRANARLNRLASEALGRIKF